MTALNTEQLGLALYEVVVKFHKYLDFIVGFGREYGSEICKQSFLYSQVSIKRAARLTTYRLIET